VTRLSRAKLALGAAGLAVWAYGVRVEDERFQWAGVLLMLGAFLLRFLNARDRR
jgi:hypothetical protein